MNDLFIGSGGFTGIKFIGALEYLHTNKMLDLKNFYGCSIGSLIGILYISGYKPIDILEMFNDFDLKSLTSFDLNNVKKNYIIDNKLLDSLLKPLLDKYEKQITLKDFSVKTGVNINIICTDITNMKCINFNNVSNPDIKLTDAIKASMTVPFIFEPVKIGNTEYIDGAIHNRYGNHPDDKYILGYIIISKIKEDSYLNKLFNMVQCKKKPRGYCIIECETINEIDKIKDLDKKFVYKHYKSGIENAREQIFK